MSEEHIGKIKKWLVLHCGKNYWLNYIIEKEEKRNILKDLKNKDILQH